MFGRKNQSAPSIVSQDAAEMLPGARDAMLHLREAMRLYPPLYYTDEYQACQRTLEAMTLGLEAIAGDAGESEARSA